MKFIHLLLSNLIGQNVYTRHGTMWNIIMCSYIVTVWPCMLLAYCGIKLTYLQGHRFHNLQEEEGKIY